MEKARDKEEQKKQARVKARETMKIKGKISKEMETPPEMSRHEEVVQTLVDAAAGCKLSLHVAPRGQGCLIPHPCNPPAIAES